MIVNSVGWEAPEIGNTSAKPIFLARFSLGEMDLEAVLESAGFANTLSAVVNKDAEAPQLQTLLRIADKNK